MFFFCLLLLLVAPALPLNAAPSIVLEVDGPGFNFPRTDKKYEFIQGQRYSIKSWYREQGNLDNWSIAPHQWIATWTGTPFTKTRRTISGHICSNDEVDANEVGRGTMIYSLRNVNDNSQTARAIFEFEVRPVVTLLGPDRIHLPWTGAQTSYTLSAALSAGGGSGTFSWSSSGSAVDIDDSSRGVVSLKSTGESTVSVCDSSNERNCKSVHVLVSKPVLQPLELSHAEFEVSKDWVQHIPVFGDDQKPFTDCLDLAQKFSVSFDGVFASVGSTECVPASESSSSSHFRVTFQAASAGFSSIVTKLGELEYKTKISAFNPLSIVLNELLSSIQGSAYLSWSGGPQQWDEDSELVVRLGPETADVERSWSAASRVVVVSCKRVHEATLQLTVRNSARPDLPHPIESSASVALKCYPSPRQSQRALRLTSANGALMF